MEITQTPKSSQNNCAYEHGSDLPERVIVQILINLPLKSVFTFKSVSKRWKSIISAPHFSESCVARKKLDYSTSSLPWTLLRHCADDKKLHDDHYTINHIISSSNDDQVTFSVCDVSFPKRRADQYYHERYEILSSSSDGLLLCRLRYDTLYAICNPVTRQWLVLPYHKSSYKSPREAFASKVDDESSLKLISYKVIRLNHIDYWPCHYGHQCDMEIYDSETKEWTESKINMKEYFRICKDTKPICFNGIVHWKSLQSDCLVTYDPYSNAKKSFRFPKSREENDSRYGAHSLFDVRDGKLQYLEIKTLSYVDDQILIIWELEHYRKGIWRLKQHIPLKHAK